MRKYLFYAWAFLVSLQIFVRDQITAQAPPVVKPFSKKNQWADSTMDKEGWQYFKDQYVQDIAEDEGESLPASVPSLLQSGKDLFNALTGFSFSVRRFRPKGLSNRHFLQFVQEINMSQLSDGSIPWASWGGLNEVTGNQQLAAGLRNNEYQFGAAGNAVFMQLNATKLFPQTTLTNNFSNRNYQYRVAFTKVWNPNKSGWTIAHSFAYKFGKGGQYPANAFEGISYFLAIDKQFKNQIWSFILLGNRQFNTRTAAVTDELIHLTNNRLYQTGWGWYKGNIKQANWQFQHQPVALISQSYQISPIVKRVSTLLFSNGEKFNRGLDWYNAPDPRPDYYRYLPSFYKDSVMQNQITHHLQVNPDQLQLNWERMFLANQQSTADKRARYFIDDKVERSVKLALNIRYQIDYSPSLKLLLQSQYKWERYHYFKRIHDLMGAAYSVNWNQFAEDDPNAGMAIQNNLNEPDQVLQEGDQWGYNYKMHLQQWVGLAQLVYVLPKWDLFTAVEYSSTQYQREGLYRSGLFPMRSFGLSEKDWFKNWQIKLGITYKINGRNYAYLHRIFSSKPPLANDIYLSPRISAIKHPAIESESFQMLELGYILNAPSLRIQFNGYFHQTGNAMDVMSFYHDGYRNLVNYALSNISTKALGLELSASLELSGGFSLSSAISLGKFTYSQRPLYRILPDNAVFETEKGMLFIKGYPMAGMPSMAFYHGLSYRLNGNLFINLSGSFLGPQYLSLNPLRRTANAIQVSMTPSEIENWINPSSLPSVYITDLSLGYSFRLYKNSKGKSYFLQCFLGVNNCLNQSFVTGGFEQLRMDVTGQDLNRFPNKYYYRQGALYSLSLKWKL